MATTETIPQKEAREETVLLQCDVPVSLMTRVRIAAAKRNSRALRPVVVDALLEFVAKDEKREEEARRKTK